ncbi:MAG: tyrosine-protein phosphatase [Planctomycetota bacterium]
MIFNVLSCVLAGSYVLLSSIANAQDERHVPLQGQSNFRDIGGYGTTDGFVVKRGMLYRSGELPKLTDQDVQKLDAIGIGTVVNFLTPHLNVTIHSKTGEPNDGPADMPQFPGTKSIGLIFPLRSKCTVIFF